MSTELYEKYLKTYREQYSGYSIEQLEKEQDMTKRFGIIDIQVTAMLNVQKELIEKLTCQT